MHSLRHQWGLLTSPLARAALVADRSPAVLRCQLPLGYAPPWARLQQLPRLPGHECPALADVKGDFPPLLADCSGIMARLVWARDQPMVSRYIIACLDRISY